MVEVVTVWTGAWFGVVVDGLSAQPAGRVVLFALVEELVAGLGVCSCFAAAAHDSSSCFWAHETSLGVSISRTWGKVLASSNWCVL